jgi:hypothetical protein
MDGAHFTAAHMSVWFGPPSDPLRYPCAVLRERTTTRTLACRTVPNAQGAGHRFTVSVVGQSVNGSDSINFPIKPVVYGVTGCGIQRGNATFVRIAPSQLVSPLLTSSQHNTAHHSTALPYRLLPASTPVSV